jgi:hypothetical protein
MSCSNDVKNILDDINYRKTHQKAKWQTDLEDSMHHHDPVFEFHDMPEPPSYQPHYPTLRLNDWNELLQ